MAKSLIRLGASLKSLTTSPKYLGTIRLCHSQNDTTELTTVNTKTPSEPTVTKTLSETTVTTRTPSEAKKLFDLFTNDINPISLIVNIEENKDKIDGRHVVVALTSMHKFYQTSRYPLANVQKSPQFIKMCQHLNKHIRTLETPQIIQALKILNLFQVSSSTTVVQNLLQLIRVSINELHPHEIYYMAFLLKNMKPPNHLANAIYTALPEVFDARLKTKIDVEDLTELSNALKFATYYTDTDKTIKFLIGNIYKYSGPISLTSAVAIFLSLCKIESTANIYYDIISRIKEVISKNLDKLQEYEIISIISKTTGKILLGYDQFYDPIFLDLLINQTIKNNCHSEKAFRILGQINSCNHIHLALLQYITVKCQNDLEILTKFPKNMQKLTQGLANSNYLPPNWEELKTEIFDNFKLLPDHVTMAYLALYLAALDECNLEMIKHIFKLDQNPDQLTPAYRETLCELYQFVKTLYPEYTGPWPMDEIVSSFRTLKFQYELTQYPLIRALNKLLGDPAYVKTNVRTNLGHHIDHLVVLQDNLPITIESNVKSEDPKAPCYVEDLNIPQDCEKVAICFLPRELCGRNIPIPSARVRVKKKTLKAMSFKVVLIPEDTWVSMPESEILPYLKHTIGLKTKNKNNESNAEKLAEASR